MSLPNEFLAQELPYKDVRNYLAKFLSIGDLFLLTKAFWPFCSILHAYESADFLLEACEKGQLHLLKWFEYSGSFQVINMNDFFSKAVVNGHLAIARWLWKNDCGFQDETGWEIAFARGYLSMVAFVGKKFPRERKRITQRYNRMIMGDCTWRRFYELNVDKSLITRSKKAKHIHNGENGQVD